MKYCRLLRSHNNAPRGSYGYLKGNSIVFPYSSDREAACGKSYVDSNPDIFKILDESERTGRTLSEVRAMIRRGWGK
jgi:hypothetical protein